MEPSELKSSRTLRFPVIPLRLYLQPIIRAHAQVYTARTHTHVHYTSYLNINILSTSGLRTVVFRIYSAHSVHKNMMKLCILGSFCFFFSHLFVLLAIVPNYGKKQPSRKNRFSRRCCLLRHQHNFLERTASRNAYQTNGKHWCRWLAEFVRLCAVYGTLVVSRSVGLAFVGLQLSGIETNDNDSATPKRKFPRKSRRFWFVVVAGC